MATDARGTRPTPAPTRTSPRRVHSRTSGRPRRAPRAAEPELLDHHFSKTSGQSGDTWYDPDDDDDNSYPDDDDDDSTTTGPRCWWTDQFHYRAAGPRTTRTRTSTSRRTRASPMCVFRDKPSRRVADPHASVDTCDVGGVPTATIPFTVLHARWSGQGNFLVGDKHLNQDDGFGPSFPVILTLSLGSWDVAPSYLHAVDSIRIQSDWFNKRPKLVEVKRWDAAMKAWRSVKAVTLPNVGDGKTCGDGKTSFGGKECKVDVKSCAETVAADLGKAFKAGSYSSRGATTTRRETVSHHRLSSAAAARSSSGRARSPARSSACAAAKRAKRRRPSSTTLTRSSRSTASTSRRPRGCSSSSSSEPQRRRVQAQDGRRPADRGLRPQVQRLCRRYDVVLVCRPVEPPTDLEEADEARRRGRLRGGSTARSTSASRSASTARGSGASASHATARRATTPTKSASGWRATPTSRTARTPPDEDTVHPDVPARAVRRVRGAGFGKDNCDCGTCGQLVVRHDV